MQHSTSSGQGQRLADFERGYLKALCDVGKNPKEIEDLMNISQSTVYKMKNQNFEYPIIQINRESKMTEEQMLSIYNKMIENRSQTASEIQRSQELNPKRVSLSTIQRLLNDFGLKCKRKQIMQDITEENKEQRFRLSKKYRRWSKERLNKIYYSDEINICLIQN